MLKRGRTRSLRDDRVCEDQGEYPENDDDPMVLYYCGTKAGENQIFLRWARMRSFFMSTYFRQSGRLSPLCIRWKARVGYVRLTSGGPSSIRTWWSGSASRGSSDSGFPVVIPRRGRACTLELLFVHRPLGEVHSCEIQIDYNIFCVRVSAKVRWSRRRPLLTLQRPW